MATALNLSDLAIAIVRKRRWIAKVTLLTATVAVGVSLVLPKWYRASGSVLPPEAGATSSALVAQMLLTGYERAFVPTGASPSDVYAAILKSETVLDAVIDSAGLMQAYRAKSRYHAVKRLKRYTRISVGMEGVVNISYEDRNPGRAAEVVNWYLRELDRFNRTVRTTSARRLREFIERRLVEVSSELKQAEENLRRFQEETGAVFISDQAKASIETAADIYVRIAELEVELERLKTATTEANPQISNIRSQIRALERKLDEMGYSKVNQSSEWNTRIFPRFSSAPEIQQRLTDLIREVEIKGRVLELLREQYEQSRIEEVKDTPTIQVLDWAKPPPIKSRPRRKLIVVTSSVMAFFASSSYAYRSLRSTGLSNGRGLGEEITRALREDYSRLTRFMSKK